MFAKNISKRKHYFLYSVMFRKCQDIYSQNIIYVLTSSKRKELNTEKWKKRERERDREREKNGWNVVFLNALTFNVPIIQGQFNWFSKQIRWLASIWWEH